MSKQLGRKFKGVGKVIVAAPLLLSLAACELMPPMKDRPTSPPATNQDQGNGNEKPGRFLPYSIRFDKEGKPVIVDQKGNAIAVKEVKPPLRATALESIQSMGSVIYKGSCKQVFNIGGKLYEVDLPPQYCTN